MSTYVRVPLERSEFRSERRRRSTRTDYSFYYLSILRTTHGDSDTMLTPRYNGFSQKGQNKINEAGNAAVCRATSALQGEKRETIILQKVKP